MAMSNVEPNGSMKAKDISLNYDYTLTICTNYKAYLESVNNSGSAVTPKFVLVAKGFDNISEALNEVLYQSNFLSDRGWGSSYVTGGQVIFTLSGVRVKGDEAQDFIFGDTQYYDFGSSRETYIKIKAPDGSCIQCPATLAKIAKSGGAMNQPTAVSVEIHLNGKPMLVPASET